MYLKVAQMLKLWYLKIKKKRFYSNGVYYINYIISILYLNTLLSALGTKNTFKIIILENIFQIF